MQHGDHHVLPPQDRGVHQGRARIEADLARITVGSLERRLGLETPAALLVDPDQQRLEPLAIERPVDVARGQERDLVLGRSTAEQDHHPNLGAI